MASPQSPQHEPTMEEILASIRKIISEDAPEAAPAAAPAQPVAQAMAPSHDADVLELTQEVHEEPEPAPIVSPAPVYTPPEPVHEAAADEVVFQTVEEAPPPAPVPRAPVSNGNGLVSDKARSAVDDALSDLDFGPEPEEHSGALPVAPIDGRSVEAVFDRAVRETFDPVLRNWLHEQADVIVERMKPAIREWMEENLPAMLKTAVEAEVARAVRARSKR
jgi:uncharacterized protein